MEGWVSRGNEVADVTALVFIFSIKNENLKKKSFPILVFFWTILCLFGKNMEIVYNVFQLPTATPPIPQLLVKAQSPPRL